MNHSEERTLYIPVVVSGITSLAVVDTAAQASVINRSLFEQIVPRPKLIDELTLKGIGESSEIPARLAERVTICTGKTTVEWNMLVADITDNIILGLDFLEHQKVIINLSDCSINMKGEKINSRLLSNDDELVKIYRIRAAKRSVVPPHSDKVLHLEFDVEPKTDIVLQPTNFMKGLLIPNLLCKGDNLAPVLLKNPTNNFVTIKKGYPIGSLEVWKYGSF